MTGSLSRRRLFAGGAAALVAGACSRRGRGEDGAGVDVDFAARAAGIEKLAWDHYVGAGTQLTAGRLGALIPEAVATLVAAAAGHHQQAHDAWNQVLASAGRGAVTTPPERLMETLRGAGIRVADVPAAAALALGLEDYACQVYLQAMPTLRGPDASELAARIAVAGHQRQAVLRYLLGRQPVAGAGADPHPRLITG